MECPQVGPGSKWDVCTAASVHPSEASFQNNFTKLKGKNEVKTQDMILVLFTLPIQLTY